MFKYYRLMNEAGGADGGGTGEGAGSPAAGFSGTGTPDGSTPSDAGTGTGGEHHDYKGPEWAKSWEGVSDLGDLLTDPALKAIQNPASLLKSYVHAQRQMGKDKVLIPNENSTQEEKDSFWQKLGIPLDEAKYLENFKINKEKAVLGEATAMEVAKLAHSLRISPDKAQQIHDFMNDKYGAHNKSAQDTAVAQRQEGLNKLMETLGEDAYKVKLSKATAFLDENAPKGFRDYLGQSGLGNDAKVVEALMFMADKFTKEGTPPEGGTNSALTINEMRAEVNSMMADSKGAYYNTGHPDHKRQLNRMLELRRKIDAQ